MLIEPVYSRISGAWTTLIVRKVIGPNGEFMGVVGRGIEPANFEKFFASVVLGEGADDLDAASRRHAARPLSPFQRNDRDRISRTVRSSSKRSSSSTISPAAS